MKNDGAAAVAPPRRFTVSFHPRVGDSSLAARLRREVEGEVLFDAASRGRYSADASIYQIEPVGVVVPRTEEAARIAMQIAIEEGVPVLPRGGGTSQCGQTVGAALVIDNSKYLNKLIELDAAARTCIVQPGIVLDHLNAQLRAHGLWFPVDVSTSAQATIGGMAGNNSCGSRSIRYGNMVHNVAAIDAWLADGSEFRFGPAAELASGAPRYRELIARVHDLVRREADEIAARWPKVLRRVQGYNLDMVQPGAQGAPMLDHNLAHLLVGSEGTLAYSRRVTLKLSPLPKAKTLGVCHFPTFYSAMRAPESIVKLDPDAVELVDRTMIELARANPEFRRVIDQFVRGEPEAILLVEFAGDDKAEQITKLERLVELMGDLGLPGSVVEITDEAQQKALWGVRKAGLNIMMSMKGEGKPVSFIEDCAVPLEHLAEYTRRLTEVFTKHGTRGTWYAHASVGTLHVRPVLNMKSDGAGKLAAIAEEACALVREYKGAAYSGEHGDGLVRSQWIEPIIGSRLARTLEEIKDLFDPKGLMNPGKIVRAPRQDDRTLYRYKPGYSVKPIATGLDWSEWDAGDRTDGAGGLAAAIETCNNNGHCRKFDAGTMCPSYRATLDEQHLTRGRANTLRLAVSGQLGPDALTSETVRKALDLCVGCKGCKRECPTGVDMARMKVEVLHQYHARHGYALKDKLIAYLPRYAHIAKRLRGLLNLRNRVPALARLGERWLGFSANRSLPQWRFDTFLGSPEAIDVVEGAQQVVLFADTFNDYFEAENLHCAKQVLEAAGYSVQVALPVADNRPLCCGRTFLAVGMIHQAREEAERMMSALAPFAERGVPIVGLEPSCLFTLRDEYRALKLGPRAEKIAHHAMLFEEFLAREHDAGRLKLALKPLEQKRALLHGHCHQKAFGAMSSVEKVLSLVPELQVETVQSSCCGMAGAFGYEAEHYDVSMKMAEAALLPAVRKAEAATLVVADGTSCRHQIADGAKREALHVARVLARALVG
jgi:FAD/FMN-containing dehydrogenase/Fe-S oxidoreductase